MNIKSKFYLNIKKSFSGKISSEKERRLNQFFKLPKSKLEFGDKVFDRPDEETSVLKNYGDQDLDRLDIMDKVIKKKKLDSEKTVNKFFSDNSTTETMKISENLIEKLRLNKEFKFTENYKQKEILNEYGNYDKYFKNYKVLNEKKYDENDDGESAWNARYLELQEKFKNPATKSDWNKENERIESKINDDISTYGADYKFTDYLASKRREEQFSSDATSTNPRTKEEEKLDQDDVKRFRWEITSRPRREVKYDIRTKKEKNSENRYVVTKKYNKELQRVGFANQTFDNTDDTDKKPEIVGRVSPWCKEEIYRNYLEGWTVKDLSYKYGLLPERVKAIVWMRDMFWKQIYPKIGESGLRRRMELGSQYAKQFAYIDYGKDLKQMALREQGVNLRKVWRGEIDCKPSKEVEEKISAVLKHIKPRAVDHIPIRFSGKGPSGYLIKDMMVKRGKGAKRVSYMFQKYCYYKDLNPNLLPKWVLMKKELGPRIATLGYSF
jgi:hypothetical protein